LAASTGKSYFKASIPNCGLSVHIKHKVAETLKRDRAVWSRKFVDASVGIKEDELFSINCYTAATKDLQNINPAPMCCAECRVLLQGGEIVFGFKLSEGESIASLSSKVEQADASVLEKMASDPRNFCFTLSPGSVATLPSGYLYMTYTIEETIGLRWSYFCNEPEESSKVKMMLAALLEAKPALRSTQYKLWFNLFD
jgi:hypothetical protein